MKNLALPTFDVELVELGRCVDFLNLRLSLPQGARKLDFSYRFRPEALYLSNTSYHDQHVHSAWPRAVARSIVNLSSPVAGRAALDELNLRLVRSDLRPVPVPFLPALPRRHTCKRALTQRPPLKQPACVHVLPVRVHLPAFRALKRARFTRELQSWFTRVLPNALFCESFGKKIKICLRVCWHNAAPHWHQQLRAAALRNFRATHGFN